MKFKNKIPECSELAPLKWQQPMLATLTHKYFSDPNWLFECKMDGERCLAYSNGKGAITLYSRSKQNLNNIYPELVTALKSVGMQSFIIDGEIVAFNKRGITSFSVLQKRLGVRNPTIKEISNTPVFYCVFDLIYFDGYDLKKVPLVKRKELLKQNIKFNKKIIYTKHYMNFGIKYREHACKKGLEGIISKKANSIYQNRRSKDWLKFKCSNRQEFVIIGYTDPKGSRVGFGALLLGYYNNGQLLYAGKVGTGFNRNLLNKLKSEFIKIEISNPKLQAIIKEKNIHWVLPHLVCEIAFTEWTDDNKLRHPRYIGIRMDKNPTDVQKEL